MRDQLPPRRAGAARRPHGGAGGTGSDGGAGAAGDATTPDGGDGGAGGDPSTAGDGGADSTASTPGNSGEPGAAVTSGGNGGAGGAGAAGVAGSGAANIITATIDGFTTPYGVAVSPDGTRTYIANYGGGTVSLVDTVTGAGGTSGVNVWGTRTEKCLS